MPLLLFMPPPAPVTPGPESFVVAELLVGPLSEPPLPWLDCARTGRAENDSAQAAIKIAFFIRFLLWVKCRSNMHQSQVFLFVRPYEKISAKLPDVPLRNLYIYYSSLVSQDQHS